MTGSAEVFLRINSRRARERVERILGGPQTFYYTWATGGCLIKVTPEQYEMVKEVKSVTRFRNRDAAGDPPGRCW